MNNKRLRRTQITTAILVTALALLALALFSRYGRGAEAGAPGTAQVRLVQAPERRAGELLTVQVVAENAANLAGFQATVRFDPTQLRMTGATIEDELGGSGRDVLPLGPVLRAEEGIVVVGAATCPVGDCDQPYPFDATRRASGVSGQVILATLNFYTGQPGSYTLSLEEVQLVDPQGETLAVNPERTLSLDVEP